MHRILQIPRGAIPSTVQPPISRHCILAHIFGEPALCYKQTSLVSSIMHPDTLALDMDLEGYTQLATVDAHNYVPSYNLCIGTNSTPVFSCIPEVPNITSVLHTERNICYRERCAQAVHKPGAACNVFNETPFPTHRCSYTYFFSQSTRPDRTQREYSYDLTDGKDRYKIVYSRRTNIGQASPVHETSRETSENLIVMNTALTFSDRTVHKVN